MLMPNPAQKTSPIPAPKVSAALKLIVLVICLSFSQKCCCK